LQQQKPPEKIPLGERLRKERKQAELARLAKAINRKQFQHGTPGHGTINSRRFHAAVFRRDTETPFNGKPARIITSSVFVNPVDDPMRRAYLLHIKRRFQKWN